MCGRRWWLRSWWGRPQKVRAPCLASSVSTVISLKVVSARLRHSAMIFSSVAGMAARWPLRGGAGSGSQTRAKSSSAGGMDGRPSADKGRRQSFVFRSGRSYLKPDARNLRRCTVRVLLRQGRPGRPVPDDSGDYAPAGDACSPLSCRPPRAAPGSPRPARDGMPRGKPRHCTRITARCLHPNCDQGRHQAQTPAASTTAPAPPRTLPLKFLTLTSSRHARTNPHNSP